jgi:hypothetical protein
VAPDTVEPPQRFMGINIIDNRSVLAVMHGVTIGTVPNNFRLNSPRREDQPEDCQKDKQVSPPDGNEMVCWAGNHK